MALPDLTTLSLRGFNLAGAEFGTVPGTHLSDYFWPDEEYRPYIASFRHIYRSPQRAIEQGYNCFRIPFKGLRILRSRTGELDTAELALMTTTVNRLTALGAYVLLDLHDFAQVGGMVLNGGNGAFSSDATGTCQAGSTATTIVLGFGSSQSAKLDDWHNGETVTLDTGPGAGESATILDYDSDTQTGTVDSAWTVTPTDATTYTVTGGGATSADLAHIWTKLAEQFKANDHVIFDIMNEPNSIIATNWYPAAQAAITAIRATGTTNLIMVEGIGFSGAHSWEDNDNGIQALTLTDSGDNMIFQAHQYFDSDNSGTSETSVDVAVVINRIEVFTDWLRRNSKKGFIGEFGPSKATTGRTSTRAFLAHMEANQDVYVGWTAWAMGPAWADNYIFRLDDTRDPMLTVIEEFV